MDDDEEFDEFDDDDNGVDYADCDAVTDQLLKTWKRVKLPNKEENLLRKKKPYAVVYSGKCQQENLHY